MTAKIIDGKAIAQAIRDEIKTEVTESDVKPGLAVVLVGDNPASQVYVRNKEKACNEVGFYSEKHELDASVPEPELLELVDSLNNNSKIHGILVQLPLPKHIDEKKVLDAINPSKDVDGFSPVSMGELVSGRGKLVACTPSGIIHLIETVCSIAGKHAVVVGRSNIVGKPVSLLLLEKNATVTICHSKSKPLSDFTKQADILIAAVGVPKLIKSDMVKDGAVVIDVGMNRVDGKLCGDVDYMPVSEVASAITPVPGGVGPMTIAMLLKNTLIAMKG